ncbi:hypothetical protein LTR17_012046 [Elasticomyces elasticus]|nr:hypothetical protein LTR17_012046 [Elasticomyces elasticus]
MGSVMSPGDYLKFDLSENGEYIVVRLGLYNPAKKSFGVTCLGQASVARCKREMKQDRVMLVVKEMEQLVQGPELNETTLKNVCEVWAEKLACHDHGGRDAKGKLKEKGDRDENARKLRIRFKVVHATFQQRARNSPSIMEIIVANSYARGEVVRQMEPTDSAIEDANELADQMAELCVAPLKWTRST